MQTMKDLLFTFKKGNTREVAFAYRVRFPLSWCCFPPFSFTCSFAFFLTTFSVTRDAAYQCELSHQSDGWNRACKKVMDMEFLGPKSFFFFFFFFPCVLAMFFLSDLKRMNNAGMWRCWITILVLVLMQQ